MKPILIKHARLVNEGKQWEADLLVRGDRIDRIDADISDPEAEVVDASGLHLIPGIVDDQVHFREPGLTHKGEIATEARAAVAGGITSYMEMPNTVPQTLTQELLEEKYQRAAEVSMANFSFYMGAGNHNFEEVMRTDPERVCGVKIFMGSSTGNMLVDDLDTLDKLFANVPLLIATHCEKEEIIRENLQIYRATYGENIPIKYHPIIRSEDACFFSSGEAVALAEKHGTRLHVLHISTAKEINFFRADLPIRDKRITAEACIHHLWFSDKDYKRHGTRIKWNPAVKKASDRAAIQQGIRDNCLDIVATDHAPHTLEEKNNPYTQAPSGGPLVQHSLVAMLELHHKGIFSLEKVVEKMCHAPTECFRLRERGYLREGYKADLVLVDLNDPWTVAPENILYKCGWSPFEDQVFRSKVRQTFVNGKRVYHDGRFDENVRGERLSFERDR